MLLKDILLIVKCISTKKPQMPPMWWHVTTPGSFPVATHTLSPRRGPHAATRRPFYPQSFCTQTAVSLSEQDNWFHQRLRFTLLNGPGCLSWEWCRLLNLVDKASGDPALAYPLTDGRYSAPRACRQASCPASWEHPNASAFRRLMSLFPGHPCPGSRCGCPGSAPKSNLTSPPREPAFPHHFSLLTATRTITSLCCSLPRLFLNSKVAICVYLCVMGLGC